MHACSAVVHRHWMNRSIQFEFLYCRFWVRAVNVSDEVITSFVCVIVDLQVILCFNITTPAMCKNPSFRRNYNRRTDKCLWKQI
jgi:hypothetical protein